MPFRTTRLILSKLAVPAAASRKGQNGRLLVIGGSKQFHGAPLMALETASRLVDMAYFSSTRENNFLARRLKLALKTFIYVNQRKIGFFANRADCVLIGPGMIDDWHTKRLVSRLLKSFADKPIVLDAGAIWAADKRLLGPNIIVCPHAAEFRKLFGVEATQKNAFECAKKFGCVVCLKIGKGLVTDGKKIWLNPTGNQGMSKGGTGDVLAGLVAGFACKNGLVLSARAGLYLNGLAADELRKKYGFHYSAQDLIEQVKKTRF
ncbi:NAD(P)H-hydrate dehydratase [Candidatus Micrarchaeota archaeon]|nr:NAD(P)H-hydrate dehydratase [Candidatus Micrarchaeota archaeon]